MSLKIRKVDNKGYFIEDAYGASVFISFGSVLTRIPVEWELKLVEDFKDILIERLHLEPGEPIK